MFTALNEALKNNQSGMGVAETHGLICGFLTSAQPDSSDKIWLNYILGDYDDNDLLALKNRDTLLHLKTYVKEQYVGEEFSLKLLLPDDEESLSLRTQALIEWIEGFLMGISLGGLKQTEQLPRHSQEFLIDLGRFVAQLDPEPPEDEENESAYMELVEYVRLGVSGLYMDCQTDPNAASELELEND